MCVFKSTFVLHILRLFLDRSPGTLCQNTSAHKMSSRGVSPPDYHSGICLSELAELCLPACLNIAGMPDRRNLIEPGAVVPTGSSSYSMATVWFAVYVGGGGYDISQVPPLDKNAEDKMKKVMGQCYSPLGPHPPPTPSF